MTAREKIASVIMAVASVLLSFGLLSFVMSSDNTHYSLNVTLIIVALVLFLLPLVYLIYRFFRNTNKKE